MTLRTRRRLLCVALAASLVVAALAFAGSLLVRAALVASLPELEGERTLAGLGSEVVVTHDERGVPRILAASLKDAARAQGFLDGQSRFFQMDLARRYAAGELAALLGRPRLALDRTARVYQFRARARAALDRLPSPHRALLEAYAQGASAGVASLGAPPPEYLLLRAEPAPWRAEDALLVVYAMFRGLNFSDRYERTAAVLFDALPEELAAFLTPDRGRFDAPQLPGDPPFAPAPIPAAEVFDVRTLSEHATAAAARIVGPAEEAPIGSNAWAVSGARTGDRRAILANDMHLGLSAPSIWRRVQIEWRDEAGAARRVGGVSLPGFPLVVAGSTERIAWGFTNAYGDFQDLVLIETHPDDASRYRTAPDEWAAFEIETETIDIRGGGREQIEVRRTIWGPVVDEDHAGRQRALRWTAFDEDGLNVDLLDIVHARSIEEALDIAARWRGPSQNVTAADHTGRVGWALSGALPKRVGFDGVRPRSWAEGDVGWRGRHAERARPRLVDPPDGVIWNANARTVPLPWAREIGRCWANPARAWRIRELLGESDLFDERALLAMQNDTRAAPLDFYRELARETILREDEPSPLLQRARTILDSWNGAADADEPGHRLVRGFRMALRARVLAPILAPCEALDESFTYRWPMPEEPVRRILEARPAHLLDPAFDSWEALMRVALIETCVRLDEATPHGLETTWGEVNRAHIAHPLADVAPFLAPLLSMPRDPLSGDVGVVRVVAPGYGSSQRTVVSPGREEDGILHIAAGQSGHFLSAHYDDHHPDWVAGAATPFLPGPVVKTLRLVPSAPEGESGSREALVEAIKQPPGEISLIDDAGS